MSKAKKICVLGSLAILLVFSTGCALFGPKLHGDTHVLKAVDGAKQIQATKEGKEVNEKLIELFNTEFVLAYQETDQVISSAQADVSLYESMPIEVYEELAMLYESVSSVYGGVIISSVDYSALIKDLDKKASKALFEAAKTISQSSDDYVKIKDAASYLEKAIALNSEYEDEANEILITVYIRLGDKKVESVKISEVEAAISFYHKASVIDKTNKKAIDKLAYAEEKLLEVKVYSIKQTIESGKTYKEFNEALRTYKGLGSAVVEKYKDLEVKLMEKLTADILVYIGPGVDKPIRSPQELDRNSPKWSRGDNDNWPQKIVTEYKKFPTLNIQIPTTHTYVLVPDKNFGKYSYDYDTTTSKEITVDSADDEVQRALYRTLLEQDPDNLEAKNALAKGVYVKLESVAKQTINEIYHVYKVENGTPKLLHSTNLTVNTKTFEQIKFVSGSKAPVEKQEGVTFTNSNIAGEPFNSGKLHSYFNDISISTLYQRAVLNSMTPYYNYLW